MPQQIDDPVLIIFAAGTLLLSIAVGLFFIVGRFGRPPLRYTPRRPVPWTAVASALVVLYVVTALASALHREPPAEKEDAPKATNAEQEPTKDAKPSPAEELVGSMLPQLFIVGGFVFVIAFVSRARPVDLGLPTNLSEFGQDVFVGIVASLVALAPVHALQALLAYLMDMREQSGHPLVKMVSEGGPDVFVMLLASLAAVVVAPICEEIAFRLFFQGWLEKWEDRRLGWRIVSSPTAHAERETGLVSETNSSSAIHEPIDERPPGNPPATGLAGLPYGWLPILISSLLFGIAHLGYGPEPVPLFFLGLVLGYVYQRTHRIVPCMVAHAVFNLFTMVILWRMVFYAAN